MKTKGFYLSLVMALAVAGPVNAAKHWVATWATAEQVVEPHNCPPPPGLQDNSIRQIVDLHKRQDRQGKVLE